MNWPHFSAFLWLRWRLRINQLRRSGIANVVIQTLLMVAAVASAAVLFVVFLSVGLFGLKNAGPVELMYVLDGMVVAFLFFWATGLLSELQRSEPLSLEKFLHLPVSVSSAFLINYLSSLPSVSLLWFLSAALGLNLGLIVSRSFAMLLLLPMLAAFVLMVTALTYQFQGWLAALMANPRRRRTIIVVATMTFILLAQVPNLANLASLRQRRVNEQSEQISISQEHAQKVEKLRHDLDMRKISSKEFSKRSEELEAEFQARLRKKMGQDAQEAGLPAESTVRLMNLLLPPGWLPAGVEAAAEGQLWPILLAILGPTLIGSASLWRAYRTTMRLYTGQYTSGHTAGAPARSVSQGGNQPSLMLRAGRNRASLLERKLPWLSEQATAITLAAFRSLVRAPEAKMLLLSPPLMLVVFGSIFFASRPEVPEAVRPLLGFGMMFIVLFSTSYLLGNQFGLDRDGFRVFVLSPARRRDILLGKNLAVAPVVLTMGAVAALVVQVIYPMRVDHFLALVPSFVSMYLLYCLPANCLSILAPMRIAPGSFQPARPGGVAILLQLLFMFLCPPLLSLTLLPLGIELAAAAALGWQYVPLDLLLSLLECAAIGGLYVLALGLQGDWLQAREQKILQIVTTKAN